jgi:PilZ domain
VADDKASVKTPVGDNRRQPAASARRGTPGEQRREQRLASDTPVTITVLGILGEPRVPGTVVDMSGSGLQLEVALAIPCGAPVRVETTDMLLLGEVVRCEPLGSAYSIGVSVSHSMSALLELERMNRKLLGEDAQVREAVHESVRGKR